MTHRQRLATLALAAALGACGNKSAATPGLLLAEPSAVAVFRGFTPKHADLHPYLAVANAASNDLTLIDAVDDTMVAAPVPLRPLVVPVEGRPALLAAARFADTAAGPDPGPDLLIAVSAGSSELQVVQTWTATNLVSGAVELGGDVLALAAVPTEPLSGAARVAAALSDRRVAVVTFSRAAGSDAIDVAGAAVQVASLAFQPVALAATPGDTTRIWAATRDTLPGGSLGVAGLDAATGAFAEELDAGAPTRLVAALDLRERGVASGEAGLDAESWSTVRRVYAVLDESGCGDADPVPCGLVALDRGTRALAPDLAGEPTFRAPISVPGRALALAVSGPPSMPPSSAPADQIYAQPFMRIRPSTGDQRTTGVAALASSDGLVYWVDLGRWVIPSNQRVWKNVGATVTPATAPGADQWLVLADTTTGATVAHGNLGDLASAVTVTPGFTPGRPKPRERWTVTYEGVLPKLEARRAESGDDGGAPWLALQVGPGPELGEVVDLLDPAVTVTAGDVVVIEPSGVPGCTGTFEATVESLLAPQASYPGGAVRLAARDPANAAWNACLAALAAGVAGPYADGSPRLRATFRAGGFVLVRGADAAAVQAGPGRPELGVPFEVMGRRLFYAPEPCEGDPDCEARWPELQGVVPAPVALGFTLALEGVSTPRRDLALTIETSDGRDLMRAGDSLGTAVDARGAVPFDRSAWPGKEAAGIRFFVPYASNVVLDGSPTDRSARALR